MTAHAQSVFAAPVSLPRRRRRRVPGPRAILVLSVLAMVAGGIGSADRLQDAATSLCTLGEPATMTCGEALVRLGFP